MPPLSCSSSAAWDASHDFRDRLSATNATASCDKIENASRRRTSPLADRAFLGEYKALKGIREGHVPCRVLAPIVGKDIDATSPSTPTPSSLLFSTTTPKPWRDASDPVKAHFAHEALATRGPVFAFTAWLSDDVNATAYAKGKPLPWIRARVQAELRKALGRPVSFMFVIEEEFIVAAGLFRLHLHGGFQIGPHERKRVRAALRKALGTWEGKAKCRQIRFRRDPDAGWPAYLTKNAWLATPRMRAFFKRLGAGRRHTLGFEGKVLTMTDDVLDAAKALHGQARQIVIEARQRPATPEAISAPEEPAPAPVTPAAAASPIPAPAHPENPVMAADHLRPESFCRTRDPGAERDQARPTAQRMSKCEPEQDHKPNLAPLDNAPRSKSTLTYTRPP